MASLGARPVKLWALEGPRKERERVQREQARHGAERAKYREGVREAQRSEKEEALERLARADEARAIALEALARTVPYFEAISNIENDVTKTTAAVEAQRAELCGNLPVS